MYHENPETKKIIEKFKYYENPYVKIMKYREKYNINISRQRNTIHSKKVGSVLERRSTKILNAHGVSSKVFKSVHRTLHDNVKNFFLLEMD